MLILGLGLDVSLRIAYKTLAFTMQVKCDLGLDVSLRIA